MLSLMRVCILLFPLLILAMSTGCSDDPDNEAEPGSDRQSTPIAAVELQPRDLSRELALSGSVEPRVRIRLASRASGTLSRVGPEEGDRVSAGEVLAELDMSEEEAELRRSRAQEQEARLSYERASNLRERQAISQSEYENARVALQVAESDRSLWQTRVAFGQVRAPRDAVITARYFEPGEAVQAQETLFELAAMDELVMRLGVSELDVVHLAPGQVVPIRLDAMPGQVFEGSIRRIFPGAEAGSRLVTVEVSLPEGAAEQGVRPGFLGRIRMPVDPRPEAIAVPASSIGEDGDVRYVYVVEDEILKRREISTGVTRGQWTEVTEGLEAGEIVLATNPLDMREGQAVRVVGWRG